jgi:hypothetical protein
MIISLQNFYEIIVKTLSNEGEGVPMDLVEQYYDEFEYVVTNFVEDIVCYAETGIATKTIKSMITESIRDIIFLESEEDIQGLYIAFQMLIADERKINVNHENLLKITTDLFVRIIEE